MKRIIALILVLMLALSLAGCNANNESNNDASIADTGVDTRADDASNSSSDQDNSPVEPIVDISDDGEKTGSKTEDEIIALYTAAGYQYNLIEGVALQGAVSGLNFMGADGIAQFYFCSSDADAISRKASKYDASATALSWAIGIDGHIVYIGNENALAVYEAAK